MEHEEKMETRRMEHESKMVEMMGNIVDKIAGNGWFFSFFRFFGVVFSSSDPRPPLAYIIARLWLYFVYFSTGLCIFGRKLKILFEVFCSAGWKLGCFVVLVAVFVWILKLYFFFSFSVVFLTLFFFVIFVNFVQCYWLILTISISFHFFIFPCFRNSIFHSFPC